MNTVFGQRAQDLFDSYALRYRATVSDGGIVIGEEIDLSRDAKSTMAFLVFLQAALTRGVEVRWSGLVRGEFDTASLHHLWPPATVAGLPAGKVRAWQETFRYGLCYFRAGPGFILVNDGRASDGKVRFVIDHPDLVATFLAGREPLVNGSLTAVQREAVDLLEAENLVYRIGELLLTLPARMRQWPVPCTTV